MALSKIWVLVERSGDKVAPVSLELLTKARELAATVEGFDLGGRRPPRRRRGRPRGGSHPLGRRHRHRHFPGPPSRPALPAQISPATSLTRSSSRRATTVATSPAASPSRSTVRCSPTPSASKTPAAGSVRARHLRRNRSPEGAVHRAAPGDLRDPSEVVRGRAGSGDPASSALGGARTSAPQGPPRCVLPCRGDRAVRSSTRRRWSSRAVAALATPRATRWSRSLRGC